MSATDSINALDSSLSASIDMSKPFLPPELERKIFELAFTFDNPVAIANRRLILVAKRVYAWLRPELYRIFFQTRGPLKRYQLYPDLRECPYDVDQKGICQYARCLFMDYTIPTSEASDLLTMCTNVENFAFWALAGLDFLWSTLSQFTNLRRLAGYMQKLTIQQLSETAFAHQLTHLELIRPGRSLQLDTGVFSDLPRLSHLALWPGDVDYQVFARALQSCEALRVLIQYTELIRVISGIDNSVATLQTITRWL
ncbi:hypothetical protein BJ165DRAFT_5712 [Panaeolus papilionaceus]|nr:hypothetical protein BJ165DRAFT_5712 [Panaeolus papilionaceus]